MHAKDRRKDQATADVVQIGVLFMSIFGPERGANFFSRTLVDPHVYRRILAGRYRGFRPHNDPDSLMIDA